MTPEEERLIPKEHTLAWLRVGFSLTAILLIQLNPQWAERSPILSHLSLYSFFLYSLLIALTPLTLTLSPLRGEGRMRGISLARFIKADPRKIGSIAACLDLPWISLIVFSTDASPIPSFALFLFPIATSSSRYGIKGSLSVALIEAMLYSFMRFTPFWGRPIGTDTFIVTSVCLLVSAYIFGCLFELELKQIQKLISLYKGAVNLATREERRRIARELHDRVLQVLGSLTLRLETCRKYLAGFPTLRLEACRKCLVGPPNLMLEACRKCLVGPPKELETELTLSEEETRSSIKEIRNILVGKATDQFTPGTLLQRLRDEINLLHGGLGLRVVLKETPEHLDLTQEAEQEVYYTLREGLTNIARHSHASKASLSLKQANGELRVSLEDNGLGFEPTTKGDGSGLPARRQGHGLESMRERVGKLGGHFSVKTAPGKGTQISFVVPLSPTPARPELNERRLDQLGETRKERFFGWSYAAYGLGSAAALLLIVTTSYLFWQGAVQENIFTAAIARYQMVTLGIADSPEAAPSMALAARLLDLSPWGYRILARQKLQAGQQKGRIFVYQGQGREYLLAQEFEGVKFLPPPGGRVTRTSSRDFVSYSQAGVNLVAWKQENLLCILASNIPEEKLLHLAQQIGGRG
ncbi:MAG: sensor histidine kinase [Candidatus Binatia bacterium]